MTLFSATRAWCYICIPHRHSIEANANIAHSCHRISICIYIVVGGIMCIDYLWSRKQTMMRWMCGVICARAARHTFVRWMPDDITQSIRLNASQSVYWSLCCGLCENTICGYVRVRSILIIILNIKNPLQFSFLYLISQLLWNVKIIYIWKWPSILWNVAAH